MAASAKTAFSQSGRTIIGNGKIWQRNFTKTIAIKTRREMKQLAAPLMITVLFVLALYSAASAQIQATTEEGPRYRTGVGVRAGFHPGFSLRHFIGNNIAVTGMLQADYKNTGRIFTVLYEWHGSLLKTERVKWIGGGGFHTGLFRVGLLRDTYGYYHQVNVNTIGFDALLGIEYYLKKIPFTVGADVKPYIDVVNPGFGNFDGALSVRYVF